MHQRVRAIAGRISHEPKVDLRLGERRSLMPAQMDTAMLFIRNSNGSHNPDERMDMDDFMLGVEALTVTLLTTAADG